jgi:hypothetical protein
MILGSNPGRGKRFLFSPNGQIGPEAHKATYSVVTFFFVSEIKVCGAHLKLLSRLRVSGAILLDPPL